MCGKLFKNIISFNRHTKFSCDHAATEPFACEACGKAYKNKGSLNRHLKYECGQESIFQCSACQYRTKHAFSLRTHIAIKHSYLRHQLRIRLQLSGAHETPVQVHLL
ncbi:gastrula zinc finger protein XlCGF17.1-like [Diaphorina citri]|uniref:Gastrula zinc finger protein XlCGF17.1-like n=1 Tax=Diaphorina citri TaxID=121845 RepID=A0A1S4EHJ2_DIACI|nr:gastrula zinc finger protein XlCGF17.1-like [Diaphorina citri]